MESTVYAEKAGTITKMLVEPGIEIEAKNLPMVVDSADTADGAP